MVKWMSSAMLQFISTNLPDKNEEELEVIEYGLQGILITIPKAIIILLAGYFLGILVPLIIALTSFGLLRTYASGLHLTNGWSCMLISVSIFFFITYAGLYISLHLIVKVFMFIISTVLLFLYAPADTAERPLVNEEHRRKLKISSLVTTCLMFILGMLIPNPAAGNIILWSLLIESVMTTPMIYSIFQRRYRNYEDCEP